MGIEPGAISPFYETTPRAGEHRFCKWQGEANTSWPGIELRATGYYIVTWPSGGYLWQGEPLIDRGLLPPVLDQFNSRRVIHAGRPATLTRQDAPSSVTVMQWPPNGLGISQDWDDYLFMALPIEVRLKVLAVALAVIPNDGNGQEREVWWKLLAAVHLVTDGNNDARELFRLWSQQSSKHGSYWRRREASSRLRRGGGRLSSLDLEWDRLDKKGHRGDKFVAAEQTIFVLADLAYGPNWKRLVSNE